MFGGGIDRKAIELKPNSYTYFVKQAAGEVVEAAVIVSTRPFSARYDLDRKSGIFSREGHPLKGQSIVGKILVAPSVQGGVAAGWALPSMAQLGVGFAGLLFGSVNPVMVQGALAAGIPIGAELPDDFFAAIKTGDVVRFDPASRTVTIFCN